MKFFLNRTVGRLVAGLNSPSARAGLVEIVRGDNPTFACVICDNFGPAVEIDPSDDPELTDFRFTAKVPGALGADSFIIAATDWEKTDTGASTVYSLEPNLDGDPLNDLFITGGVKATPATEAARYALTDLEEGDTVRQVDVRDYFTVVNAAELDNAAGWSSEEAREAYVDLAGEFSYTLGGAQTSFPAVTFRVIDDVSKGNESDVVVPARFVEVADAAARLALTTASVRNGCHVREGGRAEVTKLTCLGSTYAAAAETTEITCAPDVAGSLNSTSFYLSTLTEGVYVWFNVAGAGVDPASADRGIQIAIPTNETAVNIAIAIAAALHADADFTASRVGAVVTVVNDDPGVTAYGSSGDVDTLTFTIINPVAGAAATHTLEGDTLTLYSGANVARTVGFSLAGTTGTIAVTLPASTQTAAQIAALTQAAIEAHADFTATQGTGGATAEVTVTNAARGAATNASAGTTGFTVAVLTAGLTGTGITFVLLSEALIASHSGWAAVAGLPVLHVWRDNSTGNISCAPSVFTHVACNQAAVDTAGDFDLSTGIWTPRLPGRYLVGMSARFSLEATAGATPPRIGLACAALLVDDVDVAIRNSEAPANGDWASVGRADAWVVIETDGSKEYKLVVRFVNAAAGKTGNITAMVGDQGSCFLQAFYLTP